MPGRPIENVWNYPRPPALQATSARLRVIWRSAKSSEEVVVAETTRGYRVLETSHPPTYYFPPSDVRQDLLRPSAARKTFCEWKGRASYHDLILPSSSPLDESSAAERPIVSTARIWSYATPTPGFAKIKDYLCFYASAQSDAAKVGGWHCYVDDDKVEAQEGDFYGSWITPEITGGDKGFKGGAGTWGW